MGMGAEPIGQVGGTLPRRRKLHHVTERAGLEYVRLKVSLGGTKSNRQGIGALVRVHAGGKTWLQSAGSQGSYLSQHATPLHFGLGDATKVDRVEIAWPSGRRQSVTNISARQMLHLRED